MDETEIYGENRHSLAAIIEYLQLPNHPCHAQAKAQADAFLKAHHQWRIKQAQAAMQAQMEHISEDEWSRIVD